MCNPVILEKQLDVPYMFRATNLVQYWNNMNFHWTTIRLNEKSLHIVKYNSLISQKEKCLDEISKKFGISRNTIINDCTKECKPSNEQIETLDEDWRKQEYYKQEKYLEMYDQNLYDFVNNELDLNVMIKFGCKYRGL